MHVKTIIVDAKTVAERCNIRLFLRGSMMEMWPTPSGSDARLHYGLGKEGVGALRPDGWASAGEAMLIGIEQAPLQTVASYSS